jgi:hypothetical protein
MLSVPGVASAVDPVFANRLERLFGGGGALGAPDMIGVIRPELRMGGIGTDALMASSMSAIGVAAFLPPARRYPVPPREPNIAWAAQPALEVGKAKRSGEPRPFPGLVRACDMELIGSNASMLSGFMLSRSQVSTLEVVESLRLCLESLLLPSRTRAFTASGAGTPEVFPDLSVGRRCFRLSNAVLEAGWAARDGDFCSSWPDALEVFLSVKQI